MQRIEVIDVLRGFALIGIIVVHFLDQYYGGVFPGKFDAAGNVDLFLWNASEMFISGKFFMIFSFLFGVSFFIQRTSAQKRKHGTAFFVWRLCILLVIGLVHALHYRGDILYT
jgi:uncharacterized protein